MAGFLDLPAEIRNRIYVGLLIDPEPIVIGLNLRSGKLFQSGIGLSLWARYRLPISLLRVNKQIHEEAANVLYGCNCFAPSNVVQNPKKERSLFEHWQDKILDRFLGQIGQQNRESIRDVWLDTTHLDGGYTTPHRLSKDVLRAFALVRGRCWGVTTIRVSLSAREPDGEVAWALLQTQLNAFTALKDAIVYVPRPRLQNKEEWVDCGNRLCKFGLEEQRNRIHFHAVFAGGYPQV